MCNVGKGFSRKHNLAGHLAMHEGKKKYLCFCGASFTLKSKIGKIMYIVSRIFCIFLFEPSNFAGNLNRHRSSHHSSTEDTAARDATRVEKSASPARTLHDMSTKWIQFPQMNTSDLAVVGEGRAVSVNGTPETTEGKVKEVSDTTTTKKKRKAVAPRKNKNNGRSRSPEITAATVDSASKKVLQDLIDLGLTIGSSMQLDDTSVCLPAAASSPIYGRLSESDDSNMSPTKVTSTRRKKKTVAKASLGGMNEQEQDDVEKEWQQKMPSLTDALPAAALQQELVCDFSPFSDVGACEAGQLSSVLGELRRLKDSVSMSELMASDSLSFSREHSDLFEMEVDEHGHPRDLVTILHL